jgi:acyl carrier protein
VITEIRQHGCHVKERQNFIMDILGAIKEILAKQLRVDIDTIDETTNIVSDLGADSLDVVEMLMTIEQEYGIVVPDEAILTFKTVGDVAKYIEENQA